MTTKESLIIRIIVFILILILMGLFDRDKGDLNIKSPKEKAEGIKNE